MSQFHGPFALNTPFHPVPGVYVVMSQTKVVDVGQTENLKQRMACHERESCWRLNAANQLYFTIISSKDERLQVESALRLKHQPSCGLR